MTTVSRINNLVQEKVQKDSSKYYHSPLILTSASPPCTFIKIQDDHFFYEFFTSLSYSSSMESLELACLSLECGDDRVSSSLSDDYEASLSFSENSDSSIDGYNFINCENEEVFDSKRVLTLVKTECSVDIQSDVLDFNLLLGTAERDCRICHLSLQKGGSDIESGTAIQLGCSCKNDLAAAHQDCAETWFRIKGNRLVVF